jgi:D-hexose-6-phosphate mutarotase
MKIQQRTKQNKKLEITKRTERKQIENDETDTIGDDSYKKKVTIKRERQQEIVMTNPSSIESKDLQNQTATGNVTLPNKT